jgi:predicted nucleic-acid-binding protein
VTGLDTNLLVRYILQDEPRQAATAARELEAVAGRGEIILLQPVVLAELVWVLARSYRFTRPDIAQVLERVLRAAQFEVADRATVCQAFGDYCRGLGDFADCYIGRANQAASADTTLTFDKGLKGNPRFTVLTA